MKILVYCEHEDGELRLGSRSAIAFARQVAEAAGGSVTCLLVGSDLAAAAADAAKYASVMTAESAALASPTADKYAQVIAAAVTGSGAELLVAAADSTGKDIISRAGGLLGGAMASDVIGHEYQDGRLIYRRPMFAGAITASVALKGSPQIVTVRSSAYEPAEPGDAAGSEGMPVDEAALPSLIEFVSLDSKKTGRPDVTEARVVVSGGRALKNSEDFEKLVGGLADKLAAATGSSRALVDSGITPNEFQVGQTGKVVAPDLYIALGISGAVQHLAGMKNSKVIVAVNNDPEAPIFEVADYGLVGDVYELVPQMIEALS